MELSVIIVSYNVRYFLEQCLNSVLRASEGISCEILVVDNNSEDGSCEMVSNRFPGVKLIRNSYNAGYAKACNQALKISAGEFVLLLNPDTIVGENTFRKCIDFMRSHEDAGAMGVKMIDGQGKYLRESKRSLPVPLTAFYKMTGFSRLFPSSPRFSRYYMAHIDKDKTAEIEILTGAFMFFRKNILDKTGLFDENFFMYGEDIDLSYRILKQGYKIYYYPEEKIIHFKGESASKDPVTSTIYFYKAMLVFAGKHFGKKDVFLFHLLIKPAIYSRATLSLLKKVFIVLLPLITDIAAISAGIMASGYLWSTMWQVQNSGSAPILNAGLFTVLILSGVISIFLAGGYRKHSGIMSVIRGLLSASVLILILYALLNGKTGYSAWFILTVCISILLIVPLFRIIMAISGFKSFKNPFIAEKKAVIVSARESYLRIYELIEKTEKAVKIKGRITLIKNDSGNEILGRIEHIHEITKSNRIKIVYFALRDISSSLVISLMEEMSGLKINMKLVPEGEKVILGSKTVITEADIP